MPKATKATIQDLLEAAAKSTPDQEGPVTEITYDVALIGPDKTEKAIVNTVSTEANGRHVADTYRKTAKDGSYYVVRKVTTITEVVYRTEPAKKRIGASPVAKAALKRDAERKAAKAEKKAPAKSRARKTT